MTIPATRQRVRVEGTDATFLVVWVDHENSTAHLVPLGEGHLELLTVPFSRIRPLHPDSHETGGGI